MAFILSLSGCQTFPRLRVLTCTSDDACTCEVHNTDNAINRPQFERLCAEEAAEVFLLTVSADGPYGIFAGRDSSRGLATFCLEKDALRDEYDDLSDLNAVQMESVREWEMQFMGECFISFVYIVSLLPSIQP